MLTHTAAAPAARTPLKARPLAAPAALHVNINSLLHNLSSSSAEAKPQTAAEQSLAEEVMLKRAASRLARGTATCLSCKGKGTCMCPVCKGAGKLAQGQALMHPVKRAVRDVKSMMNVTTERDWIVSNRCRRCSAQGVLLCEVCRGSGMRYPNLIPQNVLDNPST